MLRLVKAFEIWGRNPPWSNDPDLNKRYMDIVWAERNGANIGRALMGWLAIVGWIAFALTLPAVGWCEWPA